MLQSFLMWCTIINGGLLLFWTAIIGLAPGLVYNTQRHWFPLSREAHAATMYCFLGLFKILFLLLNVVPYIALIIVT